MITPVNYKSTYQFINTKCHIILKKVVNGRIADQE